MWWRLEEGGFVNMKHMAKVKVDYTTDGKVGVFAFEIAEQSRYLIKEFSDIKQAEVLMVNIINAEMAAENSTIKPKE